MEGFCRGCLIKYNEPMGLLQYTEKNRRLFVYSTGLQVKRNDFFTFQLCKDCYLNMKGACKFKKLCRTSDKRFKNYLALKDVGDPMDFCTFLKNSDDTLTFCLPMTSGNSTPANQKCRDDDNESTCTSIRNFMTDILQGEEMPDTEARIIREVIEEEADVLDDSLDSHWLQDDMSIDTDFRLDFSFSSFSTPRTVNNDRCYTPKKYVEQKEEQVNFYTVNSEKQTKILKEFTNAFKNDSNAKELCEFGDNEVQKKPETNSLQNVKELCDFGIDEIDTISKSDINAQKNHQNLKELCNFNFDSTDKSECETQKKNHSEKKELCNFDISIDDMEKSQSRDFKNDQKLKELFGIDEIDGLDKSQSNFDLPSLDDFDKGKINTQNYLPQSNIGSIQSNNEISNDSTNILTLLKDKPCSIDRNLEEALKNSDNKEFSLDDLLVSPAAYQGASAASTPTITNILFGEKLELPPSTIKPKIGQCIETFDDVQGDIEIFEEFFQNDTKEFDIEEIKRENMPKKDGLDNILVDDTDSQILNNNIDMFLNQKDQANNNDGVVTTTENKIETTSPSCDARFDLENFYCYLCSKKFISGRALSIHFVKSHRIKIITPRQRSKCNKWKLCNACGKKFKYYDPNFFRHIKKCGKPEEIFKCDLCPVECSSQAKLDRHIGSHLGNYKKKDTGKKYVCSTCGITINKAGNYKLHMRRHTKSYITKCNECGKGFYRKFDLDVHMRRHTGETPYACKLCTKCFARKDLLTRHIQIHLDMKLFQCDHCEKKFARKNELKNHLIRQSCIKGTAKLIEEQSKKPDKDKPVMEKVNVYYATGDDAAIKKQLPFLETERSN